MKEDNIGGAAFVSVTLSFHTVEVVDTEGKHHFG